MTTRTRASAHAMTTRYRITLEVSLIASLLVVIGLLQAPLRPNHAVEAIVPQQETVSMEEVQQTQHEERPPPPPRPQVPVAVADDVVLEDVPLVLDASLDLDAPMDLPALPPPPPPPPEQEAEDRQETEIFVAVEQMPEMIGGARALYAVLEYPDLARKAGVEGTVIVQIVIDEEGRPTDPVIIRSGSAILDRAAIEGVLRIRFTPGMQRGQPVKVRMAIPVRFELRGP